MRSLLLCLILFTGCKPGIYFLTANQLRKQKVILFLRDGSKVPGLLTVTFETFNSANITYSDAVEFIPEGKDSMEKIKLNAIDGYAMGNDFYALKKLDIYMNSINRLLFVKRLSPENSKIQLYELYESGRGNYSGEVKYSYYLTLPSSGPLETINTRSSVIMPSFELKMSNIVADCPSLAEKIRLKQEGYFLPMVTFNIKKHPEVLLKIINEYNACR